MVCTLPDCARRQYARPAWSPGHSSCSPPTARCARWRKRTGSSWTARWSRIPATSIVSTACAPDGGALGGEVLPAAEMVAGGDPRRARLLADCAAAEIPVVAPRAAPDGGNAPRCTADDGGAEVTFRFALFRRSGGRSFEPESADAFPPPGLPAGARATRWGPAAEAPHRVLCAPVPTTASFVDELLSDAPGPPGLRGGVRRGLPRHARESIAPLFEAAPAQRIHGDCHRGNVIDRPGEGLPSSISTT